MCSTLYWLFIKDIPEKYVSSVYVNSGYDHESSPPTSDSIIFTTIPKDKPKDNTFFLPSPEPVILSRGVTATIVPNEKHTLTDKDRGHLSNNGHLPNGDRIYQSGQLLYKDRAIILITIMFIFVIEIILLGLQY